MNKKKIILGSAIVVVIFVVMLVVGAFKGNKNQTVYRSYPAAPAGGSNSLSSEQSLLGSVSAPSVPEMEVAKETAVDESSSTQERLIIKTAILSIVTEDVAKSADDLKSIAEQNGGHILSVNVSKIESAPAGRVTFKVPVEKFDAVLDAARKVGLKVASENVSGSDVTEEYVDVQSRIRNLQASETAFLKIMEQSGKITDILQVQKELERVRGQIEQAQGRAKYLETSAELATITVNLSTDEGALPVVDPVSVWRPWTVIKAAFRSLISVLQGVGTLLIWLIVFIPIWAAAVLIIWLLLKFKNRKQQN